MTATQEMPQVQDCSASSCSYNADAACHAGAITIGGDHAHCGTFVEISFRSGIERTGSSAPATAPTARTTPSSSCTAAAVQVGMAADKADCLTYSAR